MINPSKKQMIAAYCVAAVLTILLILSKTVFSTDSAASKKRHSIQLQLIHEADISNIDIITIQHADSAIILTRTDNMWLIVNQNDVNDKIPADTERLKSFLFYLRQSTQWQRLENRQIRTTPMDLMLKTAL